METFCRITMQLPLFELKLKTMPLLHHRDHFVSTRKFLKYVITVSQIARILMKPAKRCGAELSPNLGCIL